MSTSNDSVHQKLFEELQELAEGYGKPGETLEETLVAFWKNPKAAAIRERLRLQGVSDDRIGREAFRKVLRRGRMRQLVSELQSTAKTFKDGAIVITFGNGRGDYVRADHTETPEGHQRIFEQLMRHMDAGGIPLGIVGVAEDGLVYMRPLEEFANKPEVLAILKSAVANLSRQNPSPSAN